MKKIIGILGVSLVIAVSFFNMSSVVDVNQNIDLASIIQNASADSESGDDYEVREVTTKTRTWVLRDGKNEYTVEQTTETVTCSGRGPIPCEPGIFPGEVLIVG